MNSHSIFSEFHEFLLCSHFPAILGSFSHFSHFSALFALSRTFHTFCTFPHYFELFDPMSRNLMKPMLSYMILGTFPPSDGNLVEFHPFYGIYRDSAIFMKFNDILSFEKSPLSGEILYELFL